MANISLKQKAARIDWIDGQLFFVVKHAMAAAVSILLVPLRIKWHRE
jgi:hypothetical protein